MNGYELCKKLKQLPEAEHTKFYSQSGWGNKEHIEKSKEAGFLQHLVKPVKFGQLRAVLSGE
jgi:CheY-like chemotaxis protein